MRPIDRLSQIKSRFKWRSNYTDIHTLSFFFMSRRKISVDKSSDKGLLFVNSKYLPEFEEFYHNQLTRPLNTKPTTKNLKSFLKNFRPKLYFKNWFWLYLRIFVHGSLETIHCKFVCYFEPKKKKSDLVAKIHTEESLQIDVHRKCITMQVCNRVLRYVFHQNHYEKLIFYKTKGPMSNKR